MFLVPINISTFCFSPFKIFLKLLVPIKFQSLLFVPIFKLILVFFFNEIAHKCVEYYKNIFQKKLEFFNKI